MTHQIRLPDAHAEYERIIGEGDHSRRTGRERQVLRTDLRAERYGVNRHIERFSFARGKQQVPVAHPEQLAEYADALFDHAYVQFRTEPAGAPGPDWLVLLTVVHRIDDYATTATGAPAVWISCVTRTSVL